MAYLHWKAHWKAHMGTAIGNVAAAVVEIAVVVNAFATHSFPPAER